MVDAVNGNDTMKRGPLFIERNMTLEEAIRIVEAAFPFDGYVNQKRKASFDIAQTVQKYLTPPARILDFGAGPCDKTSILAVLGYECFACDDLSDDWHLLEGNRETILAFASKFNIQYHISDSTAELPFAKGQFDMLMMHHVLEHLHDSPRDLINGLLELVKPRGYLFVTVPNAANLMKRAKLAIGHTNLPSFETYYWYPNPWRGHHREYVRGDLLRLTEYLGLECVEIRGCHHMIDGIPAYLRPVWTVLTSGTRFMATCRQKETGVGTQERYSKGRATKTPWPSHRLQV
jgi:SAM-dependent methyltransferase